MSEKEIMRVYLKALEKALLHDSENHGFQVYPPNWYIEDEKLADYIDNFEAKNYDRFKDLFEPVAIYFDAISHYFTDINGVDVLSYKSKVLNKLYEYNKIYEND